MTSRTPQEPSRPSGPPAPGSLPGPHAAYLRVYEPVSAFPEGEREAWADYARSSGTRAGRVAAEQHRALAGVLSVPPRPVPDEEEREAFVLEVDSVVHVCPAQTRLRSWLALGRFRDGLPDSLLHAFVPPLALERAEADHARWGGEQADAPLRILTATWSVPLPWFVPFVPADRLVDLTGRYPAVVHRTRMSAARRRVARALRALQRADLTHLADVVAEVGELGRWLEEFHSRSWIELDYAGLARLLGRDGVLEDDSVAEVAATVAALAEDDPAAAARHFAAVIGRWSAVQALERAN
ncbi:MAG TPA: hypothetical protein VK640_17355 [Actinomycetes bacterium]|nr:hypothetical protein [Actinomycetes bacterium]